MNKKPNRFKKFVTDHKTELVVTALTVTTVAAVVTQLGVRSLNEFLKEHDLYDEYYALDEE